MKVFINLTKETIQVRIGRERLDIEDGIEVSNDGDSSFIFTDESFTMLMRFIEQHAFSDRLILKNRIFLSRPRKIFIRSDYSDIADIKYIIECSQYFWGRPKIYSSDDVSFEELLNEQLDNKFELFKKYFFDIRLKHTIGANEYLKWKKECLLIHLATLLVAVIEFYFISSFILFPFIFWIAQLIWFRKRLKSSLQNLTTVYFLFILTVYIISAVIAGYSSTSNSISSQELTIVGSLIGALVFLSVNYSVVRWYLHSYRPMMF